jgi:tRNA(Ile)-lysidine synthase
MMLYRKFKATVAKYHLLEDGDRVLVACSGGADSMALTDLLLELGRELSLELVLAHFNHRLRPSADEDEEFVRSEAARRGLPLIVFGRHVRSYARRRRQNLEEAARELRYSFLKKAAAQSGAGKIATGHTMTDQAETVLMRLFRGSGLLGLGGIAPSLEGKIIRPLIEIERSEIEDYLRKRGLSHRVDESNFDRRFLRNRIRLDLLPELEKNYARGIEAHLARLASILREEESLLEAVTNGYARRAIFSRGGQPALDVRILSASPPALARRLVRRFLLTIKGDLRAVSFADVEDILGLENEKEKTLPKGLALKRGKDLIFVKEQTPPAETFERSWNGRKTLRLAGAGLEVQAKNVKKSHASPFAFDDNRRAYLDFAKLGFPLLVRNRKPGDCYRPFGAPGRKKLKEIMRAKGIPEAARASRPVFVSGGKIIWVPGCPVAEAFMVKKSTKDVFLIEIKQ